MLYPAIIGMPVHPPPLMPAHAGIQLSPHNHMPLKTLDSRVRGNERVRKAGLPLVMVAAVVRHCRSRFPLLPILT